MNDDAPPAPGEQADPADEQDDIPYRFDRSHAVSDISGGVRGPRGGVETETLSRLGQALNPFNRVRWSDGRIVAVSYDRAALALHLLSWLMAAMALATAMWTDGFVYWLSCAVMGYVADVLARERLRRAANEAESLGFAPDVAFREPWRVRLLEWLAVGCHKSEDTYLAKAARADESGRNRAGERFRRRAAWSRGEAERCRRSAQQLRSQSSVL